MELLTTRMGSCYASGTGGGILGRGADVIIVDDPIKGIDALSEAERRRVAEFYDNTLVTRLNDKRAGAIVIIMQRLHQDDLVGHVLARDDWEVISLPAIAEADSVHQLSNDAGYVHVRRAGDLLHADREPLAVLEQVRRSQGSLTFQAQYQQDPVPPGGNIIRREWLRYFTDVNRPGRFDRTIVSWDTASTLGEANDYSVGTVWGAVGLDYYLLDLVRKRLETPDLRREIIGLSRHWNADATLIENTELGRALVYDLRRTDDLRPILQLPRYDKEARLLAQSARFEAGQIYLPQDAPWLGDYLSELLAFPNGRHDDQVDSTSQALNWLTARTPLDRPVERRNPTRRTIVRSRTSNGTDD
jgi:predicted phage terminase large subunit-like protein